MKKITVCVLLIALAAILSACGVKKAEPIKLPDISDIEYVKITQNNQTFEKADSDWISKLVKQAGTGKPTTKESIQDVPNVAEYTRIDFVLKNSSKSTLFVYQEKGKWYIEQPYQGIYITDSALSEIIDTGVEQVEEVPTMRVEYTVDGNYNEVVVSSGTASWHYEYEYGTGFGVESDAPHPLDMLGVMPEIEKSDDLNELNISFSLTPDSFFVRRWVDDYIGKTQEYEDSYEAVAISGNAIVLLKGCVYEVNAIWPQGNANYVFYVK